jgi:hypothetical protein
MSDSNGETLYNSGSLHTNSEGDDALPSEVHSSAMAEVFRGYPSAERREGQPSLLSRWLHAKAG